MALKGGNLFVDRIDVRPERVRPGETVTVEVVVGNGALAINPITDQDACAHDSNDCSAPGLFDTRGYCAEVTFSQQGRTKSRQNECIHIALQGVGKHTFTETFTAPSGGGDYTVDITLAGAGSGESERHEATFTVEAPGNGGNGGSGTEPCSSNDDCPEGYICQNGGCVKAVAGVPQNQAIIAGGGILLGLGLIALSSRNRG